MARLTILLLFISYFLHAQVQEASWEEITQLAKEQNKDILLVYSGSDWCKPCIKFKKDVLDHEDFQTMKNNFVYVYLDFPYKRKNKLATHLQKRNDQLAEKYNPSGQFPFSVVISPNEELIQTIDIGLDPKPKNISSQLQKLLHHE